MFMCMGQQSEQTLQYFIRFHYTFWHILLGEFYKSKSKVYLTNIVLNNESNKIK